MTDEERELVEMMIEVAYAEPSCSKETGFYRALNVVKANLGKICKNCPYKTLTNPTEGI